MTAHWKRISKFDGITKQNEIAQSRWERLVVLKQMCGNNAISILIAGILLSIKFFPCYWTSGGIFILTILMFGVLYWGHRNLLNQQMTWENLFINPSSDR